jgi:hypothetical protein
MANSGPQLDPLKKIARGRGITLFRLVTPCGADPEEQAGRGKSAGISARDIPVIAVTLTAKTASNPPLPIAWSRGRSGRSAPCFRSAITAACYLERVVEFDDKNRSAVRRPVHLFMNYSLFPNQKDNRHAFSRL